MATAHASTASTPHSASTLRHSLGDNWWLVLLRGIAAIAFGILALLWPGKTILILTLMWGAYAIVDGIVSLWAGLAGGSEGRAPRWWLILIGIVGVVAGVAAMIWPALTAVVLLLYIAIWAIIVGASEIAGAIALRKEIEGEWLLGLTGLVTMLFGLFMLFQPAAGILAVIWMIGIWAIVMGVLQIVLSFRLRSWRHA
jgi:uncharacterized membrane protein HdeD (DUF308 family)